MRSGGSVVAQFCLKCLWRIISFLFLKISFVFLWPDSAFMNFLASTYDESASDDYVICKLIVCTAELYLIFCYQCVSQKMVMFFYTVLMMIRDTRDLIGYLTMYLSHFRKKLMQNLDFQFWS